MSEKKAKQILEFDDDHDFWKSGTAKTVVAVKKEMVAKGINSETADEWIRSIYSAASSEYGN